MAVKKLHVAAIFAAPVMVLALSGQSVASALTLPRLGHPSQCTMWLANGHAVVNFQSDTARGAARLFCRSWIVTAAKAGTLWNDVFPSDLGPYENAQQICRLNGDGGYLTIDDVKHGATGTTLCRRWLATGRFTELQLTDVIGSPGPRPPHNRPAPSSTPALAISNKVLREPSVLGFSADAGNVVTGLKWSWGSTRALGFGQSFIQTCEPSCATGGEMPVDAYVLLTRPRGGLFTRVTESQGGNLWHGQYVNAKRATGTWPQEALSYRQTLQAAGY